MSGPILIASTERNFRPATPVDLVGKWEQIAVQSNDPERDISDPWLSAPRYYWFRPLEDGKQLLKVLDFEAGAEAFEELKQAWEADPWNVVLRWRPGGRALLTFIEQRKQYYLVVTAFTGDLDTSSIPEDKRNETGDFVPMKGDISLTYVDGELMPLYVRLLRRVD